MGYSIQVKKKGAASDWQEFPVQKFDKLDKVSEYVNGLLQDVADASGGLAVQIIKLERNEA